MAASAWRFQYSQNVSGPSQSGAGWSFIFPVNQDGIHYLVTAPPVLSGKSRLKMSGSIAAAPGVKFVPETFAGTVDTSGRLANCRAYFQKLGDDLSGGGDDPKTAGPMQYYRWWYNNALIHLQNGPFNFTISFADYANWASVYGVAANANPTAQQHFAQALADPAWMGITCGGIFAGHGAYATGAATFDMTSYSVQ